MNRHAAQVTPAEWLRTTRWGGGPARLLGSSRGQAWLLRDGTVAKFTSDQEEIACVLSILERPTSPHLPQILGYQYLDEVPISWPTDHAFGWMYYGQPTFVWRRPEYPDIPDPDTAEGWDALTCRLRLVIAAIALKTGLWMADYYPFSNWGLTDVLVFRDPCRVPASRHQKARNTLCADLRDTGHPDAIEMAIRLSRLPSPTPNTSSNGR